MVRSQLDTLSNLLVARHHHRSLLRHAGPRHERVQREHHEEDAAYKRHSPLRDARGQELAADDSDARAHGVAEDGAQRHTERVLGRRQRHRCDLRAVAPLRQERHKERLREHLDHAVRRALRLAQAFLHVPVSQQQQQHNSSVQPSRQQPTPVPPARPYSACTASSSFLPMSSSSTSVSSSEGPLHHQQHQQPSAPNTLISSSSLSSTARPYAAFISRASYSILTPNTTNYSNVVSRSVPPLYRALPLAHSPARRRGSASDWGAGTWWPPRP
ncbi:hypothetical protein ON010_g4550 [Phytophthora cinnamomi]|nr:hypothetical protein ON010_g4550 [Phytophthora cinnamomi]